MATNLLILSELLRIDAPLKENRLLVTVGAQGFRYHVVSKYSISGWRNRCARTAAGEYAGQPLEPDCASYAQGLAPPGSCFRSAD